MERPRVSEASDSTSAVPGLRRALARARDGKTLDLDEATILLHARGQQLEDLFSHAARTRDAGLEAAGRLTLAGSSSSWRDFLRAFDLPP